MTQPWNYPPSFTPPPVKSALVALYSSVSQYFTDLSINAKVYLGLRYRDLYDTSRVVIIDGEFDGSNTPRVRSAGRFLAPWQKQSTNPRELVGWERPVTLSIRAVDPTNPDDETLQTAATEALIESTIQAVHNAMAVTPAGLNVAIGQNNVDWRESKAAWVDAGTATQQNWGKEFLVTFLYKCVLFDLAEATATPTPNLEKGPMLSNPSGGVNATIVSASSSAQTAVIGNLGLRTPGDVGLALKMSGAANAPNDGTFPIVAFLSPTTLVIANAAAVAPDANSGSIVWQVVPQS